MFFFFQMHLLFTMKAFTKGEWFRITIDEKFFWRCFFLHVLTWRRPFWDPGRFQQALPFFSTIQPGCLSCWVVDSVCCSSVVHLFEDFRHDWTPWLTSSDHLPVVRRVNACRIRRFAPVWHRRDVYQEYAGWSHFTYSTILEVWCHGMLIATIIAWQCSTVYTILNAIHDKMQPCMVVLYKIQSSTKHNLMDHRQSNLWHPTTCPWVQTHHNTS